MGWGGNGSGEQGIGERIRNGRGAVDSPQNLSLALHLMS